MTLKKTFDIHFINTIYMIFTTFKLVAHSSFLMFYFIITSFITIFYLLNHYFKLLILMYILRWVQDKVDHLLCHIVNFCRLSSIDMPLTWHKIIIIPNLLLKLKFSTWIKRHLHKKLLHIFSKYKYWNFEIEKYGLVFCLWNLALYQYIFIYEFWLGCKDSIYDKLKEK